MEKFLYELNFKKINCLKLDNVEKHFDMIHSARELTLDEVKVYTPFILNGTLVFKGPEDKNPSVLYADDLKAINGEIIKKQEASEEELKLAKKLQDENQVLNEELVKLKEDLLKATEEAAIATAEFDKKTIAFDKLKAENKELKDTLKGK